MTIAAIFGFITSPIGRWLTSGLVIIAIVSGVYLKGRYDGRASYKAKIEREIATAIKDGKNAKANALREFDASPDELHDDGFTRP